MGLSYHWEKFLKAAQSTCRNSLFECEIYLHVFDLKKDTQKIAR